MGKKRIDVDGDIYGCYRVIRRDGHDVRRVHVECLNCGTSRMVELSAIRNKKPPACPSCIEAARRRGAFLSARPMRRVGKSIGLSARCVSRDIGVRFQALLERESIGRPMTPREQLWCDMVVERGRRAVQRHWRRWGRAHRPTKTGPQPPEPWEVPEVIDPGLHWGLTGTCAWREEP